MYDLTLISQGRGVMVDLQVKGLPATIFQDCVSIFVNVKPDVGMTNAIPTSACVTQMDIFKETSINLCLDLCYRKSGHLHQVFLTRTWEETYIANIYSGDEVGCFEGNRGHNLFGGVFVFVGENQYMNFWSIQLRQKQTK